MSLAILACGPKPAATTSLDASVAVTPACMTAREARSKATELERGGHETLALAKIAEANAACPSESAQSAELEKLVRANLAGPGGAPKGTDASMRAKMREAYSAERAKDFPRAKSLYEAAWGEMHPNPRALEDAARMAALAGDSAASRRIRDRALAEAETAEHAVARLTDRIRVARGSAILSGTTLTLAHNGNVVARDTATGEIRVLVDGPSDMALSRYGTLAFQTPSGHTASPLTVYDVLTGARLFRIDKITRYAVSPDDALIAVIDEDATPNSPETHARVFDVATGEVKTKLTGKWRQSSELVGFGPDASHVIFYGDDTDLVFRPYDLDKGAYTGTRIASSYGVSALSSNGHYLAYLETTGDGAPLHVRDLVANKDVGMWAGRFHSVEALAVSNDGKTVATGSYGSLRLWDVAQKKQLFVHNTESRLAGATDSRLADEYSFSDDGKTMVLAGYGVATAWDVTTGAEKPFVSDVGPENVLAVVKAPDGVAIIAEDLVQIVPTTGDPRVVCKGLPQPYSPIIGPTNVAFSASGKSFACVMSDGWAHVFDTTTWTERAVIKKGAASPIAHPVDLAFSADEKALTIVSNAGSIVYDATTGAETKRAPFRHPKSLGFAPRHARFDDGSALVRLWNGSASIFGADGAWQRDVKLVSAAPADALDAFASGGATYAVALGKTVHVVDLASGEDHSTDLASAPKSLAVSSDGKTVLAASADGSISTIAGGVATALAHATGIRVGFAGKSMLVWRAKDVLDLYAPGAASPFELDVDGVGVFAQDAAGAFDVRGKPELVCVVGQEHAKTFLTRETCGERAKDGLVGDWLRAAR